LRFGVIGTGKMGMALTKSMTRYGECVMVLADHTGVAEIVGAHGAMPVSVEEMSNASLDVVIVASPIHTLPGYLNFVKCGSLFVEKPAITSSTFQITREGLTYVNFSWLHERFSIPGTGDIRIVWRKPKVVMADIDLNLLVHPVSLLIDRAGEVHKSDVRLTKSGCVATFELAGDRRAEVIIDRSPDETVSICNVLYRKEDRHLTVDPAVDDFMLARSDLGHVTHCGLHLARKVVKAIGR
jgi:hypothetical protein